MADADLLNLVLFLPLAGIALLVAVPAGQERQMRGLSFWVMVLQFVLTAWLHGLGLVMYVLLWIFVPLQTETPRPVAPLKE